MKILIVTERYWPEVGAAPSRLTNMAEGLKGCGCEVDVLTCLPNYPKGKIQEGYRGKTSMRENRNGIDIFRYWIYATVSKSPIARVLNMFSFAITMWLFAFKRKRIKDYDMVIIQTPSLVIAASAMLIFKKLYGKCCVLNVSDIWPLTAYDMGAMTKESKSYKFMAMLERFLYRNSDAIFAQSQETIDYIKNLHPQKNFFLYRNLQRYQVAKPKTSKGKPLKIVYAGLLGVAQDILSLLKNIDFESLCAEIHLYGGGNQVNDIEDYLKQGVKGVFYHGFVEKSMIAAELSKYDASVVPLAMRITGAVPSKIFDILPVGLPILFCGGGEGVNIINKYRVGFISEPGDYAALSDNIRRLSEMSDEEYGRLSENCINTAKTDFDFDIQMRRCIDYLKKIQ